MKSINKLKEITNNLPPLVELADIVRFSIHDTVVNYLKEDGSCIGRGLLNIEECSVMDMYIKKGGVFPPHAHPSQVEYGIVYDGSILVKIGDEDKILNTGDFVKFEKGNVHSGTAIQDTRLIAVAIPRINEYPKA